MDSTHFVHENKEESSHWEVENRGNVVSPRFRSRTPSLESSEVSEDIGTEKNHVFPQKRNSIYKISTEHLMRKGSTAVNLNLKMDLKARYMNLIIW